MFSANFNRKLGKGQCVSPGKILPRALCAEVVGNMSMSRQVGACGILHGFSVSQLSWQLFNHSHNFSSILQQFPHISNSDFPSEAQFYFSSGSVFGCFSLSVLRGIAVTSSPPYPAPMKYANHCADSSHLRDVNEVFSLAPNAQ